MRVSRSQKLITAVLGVLLAAMGLVEVSPVAAQEREVWPVDVLERWRDASNDVLSLPGVSFNDVDEVNHRLVVAVTDKTLHAAGVEAFLAAAGVPRDAVTIIEASMTVRQNLTSKHRPMVGGLQIEFQMEGFLATGQCTLGFPVRLLAPNQNGFVTNSHCTRTQGGVESARYWQATRPLLDNDQAGTEIIDPPYVAGGTCPTGRRCRQSDAAVVQATNAAPVTLGAIARTAPNVLTWNGTDRYQVTSEATTPPAVGVELQRVGRTSGRTFGPVTHTCVNVNVQGSDLTIRCEDIFRAESAPGDSGSPVFRILNAATNDVELDGIAWGSTTIDGANHVVYSYISGIETDLGGLTVTFGS